MNVQARFTCASVCQDSQGGRTIILQALTTGTGSEDFTQYTPSGRLEMYISAGARAQQAFEPGRIYDLIFTPIESAQQK